MAFGGGLDGEAGIDRRSLIAARGFSAWRLSRQGRNRHRMPRRMWRCPFRARTRGSCPPRSCGGAATAGHQLEGNNVNADAWLLENIQPTMFEEPSRDATDSLFRYRQDIDLLRSFGLNTYRFSIEWARIEPSPGHISIAALDHYKRMIDYCINGAFAPP